MPPVWKGEGAYEFISGCFFQKRDNPILILHRLDYTFGRGLV